MEVLLVVEDPEVYRTALDTWRRVASIVTQLPPVLAVCHLRGEAPDVPGTRWYTNSVPPDVLLRLDFPARVFVASWQDRRRPPDRPGDGPTWDERGYQPV